VARLFGTDGVRGVFGTPPLVRELVAPLGRAVGELLARRAPGAPVVLGGDTRWSTPELAQWVADGLAAAGVRTQHAGVVPTPAVAWLARGLRAAAGVAVSASHNPADDNGVKLIDAEGLKWSEADEEAVERQLDGAAPEAGGRGGEQVPPGPPLRPDETLAGRYLDGLTATLDAAAGATPLAGLRVALDTANGATAPYAAELFARLGAAVHAIHDLPDGRNINRGCGSTHPQAIAAEVVASGAHLGAAFDGDGDRAILADERGEVRDGDAMLYLWARTLAAAGELVPRRVVATSMSNLGLEVALRRERIEVVRCDVGDRAVVETMRREGIRLGGEQSGHLVHRGLSSTGDGMLTALQLCLAVARAGKPLSELVAGFERYPQLLRNVRVAAKRPFAELPLVAAARRHVEERLGDDGRLVLRYSGTEPLARIMIEGPEQGTIEALADELASAIHSELGSP
jgi:phosphoglucosamine mutase